MNARAWPTLFALSLAIPAQTQERDVDPLQALCRPQRGRLERLAEGLARDGWEEAARACIPVYEELGAKAKDVQDLRADVDEELARERKSTKRPPSTKRHERDLASLATSLVELGADAPPALRERLAGAAVRLDGECQTARASLGLVRCEDGRWRSEEGAHLYLRGQEIGALLSAARALPIELPEIRPDSDLLASLGRPIAALEHEGLRFASTWPLEKLRGSFEASVRSMAFSNALVGGSLAPKHEKGHLFHVGTRPEYLALVDLALGRERITTEEHARARKLSGFLVRTSGSTEAVYDLGRLCEMPHVLLIRYDEGIAGEIYAAPDPVTPYWVLAGHWTFVAGAMYGSTPSNWVIEERRDEGVTVTSSEMEHLARSGLVGSRAYLRELARTGNAPAIASCVVDQYGKLDGVRLLKATSVVELMHLHGELAGFLDRFHALREQASTSTFSVKVQMERTEKALGCSLPELDARWERWILEDDEPPSVRDLLREREQGPGAAQEVVERLNALRAEMGLAPVRLDEPLSRGCERHAAFLALHREQLGRWPDAHEEDPRSEGFTPEGAWAGAHSVIAPNGAEACLEDWLATYYHRLPLVRPYLMWVGFGSAGDVCVMDVESVVDRGGSWAAPYPWDGQSDVPTRFRPELPNPVPFREDQSGLGYPVTMELSQDSGNLPARFELYAGDERVPCYYSGPDRPLNPLLAPDNAYCLIPEAPLAPNTKHSAVFEIEGWRVDWSFTTGSER